MTPLSPMILNRDVPISSTDPFEETIYAASDLLRLDDLRKQFDESVCDYFIKNTPLFYFYHYHIS